MQLYDIHTHILPQADDGSKSVEQSLKLINLLKKQGIKKIAFTPHYYSGNESIEDFLKRRTASIDLLKDSLPTDISYTVGAEVFYSDYLLSLSDVSSLCYNGTDYMLIEMGYDVTAEKAVERIERLISRFNITPIFAHIERYRYLSKPFYLDMLISSGCLVQVNWESMDTLISRLRIKKLIAHRMVHFFGTDTHSEKRGIPNLEVHLPWLNKKFGDGFMNFIEKNSEKLFAE